MTDTVCFNHKYITIVAVSKVDTIVAATRHLAQVLWDKLEPNIGEKNIAKLKCLIDAISNTMTITKETWAEQNSQIIPDNYEQPRVLKQGTMQKQQHLPANLSGNTHTKESQKIVASPTIPPVVVSPPTPKFVESPQLNPSPLPNYITQEDECTPTPTDRLVDNTHAKILTSTLTQDFLQHMVEEEVRKYPVQGRSNMFEIAGAILNDDNGKRMKF